MLAERLQESGRWEPPPTTTFALQVGTVSTCGIPTACDSTACLHCPVAPMCLVGLRAEAFSGGWGDPVLSRAQLGAGEVASGL